MGQEVTSIYDLLADTAFLESGDIVHQWFENMLDQYDQLGRQAVRA